MVNNNWTAVISAAMGAPYTSVFFDGIDTDLTDCNIPFGYQIIDALDTYYVEAFGKIYWRWELYGEYDRYCVINYFKPNLLDSMDDKAKISELWRDVLPWKPCIRIVVEKAKEGD